MIASMGGSVLIVDDDPAFRALARRMLRAVGLRVSGEAEDAGAAIAAASALRPEAILVDVGLPDRDGFDLARDLAALPWGPRVLLTSSDSDAADTLADNRSAELPFIPKQDLPNAPLRKLLGP
jgi:DNA-binding NarL/FixJ family response regulator